MLFCQCAGEFVSDLSNFYRNILNYWYINVFKYVFYGKLLKTIQYIYTEIK